METKTIQYEIEKTFVIPCCFEDFSSEEKTLALQAGIVFVKHGYKAADEMSHQEKYDKIKQEMEWEIKKKDMELAFQRETAQKVEEKIRASMLQTYTHELERKDKIIKGLIEEVKCNEGMVKEKIYDAIDKTKYTYEMLLKEKEKQNQSNIQRWDSQQQKYAESIEKINDNIFKMANKSHNKKATEGEKQVSDYLKDTFRDFKDFELVDTHTQPGAGDFQMHFENFDVLVDAKNYNKNVGISQIEKIKSDLIKNKHISFAWMISLYYPIDKWDKASVMYEWINTNQCVVYINSLTEHEDANETLRLVWYTSRELYKLIQDVDEDEKEVKKLKEERFKWLDAIRNARKRIREINTSINGTQKMIISMDEDLRILLENETKELLNSNFSLFDNWWDQNIEWKNDTSLLSTDVWYRFRQDNKDMIKEKDITPDKFKQYIKTKVDVCHMVLRGKHSQSAFDIKGIQFKQQEQGVKMENKIDIAFTEKPKSREKKSTDVYFDEETDNKILSDYQKESNDIMTISEIYDLRPWQIISVLMKHKVISYRGDARGMDFYKQTDEYNEKMKTK